LACDDVGRQPADLLVAEADGSGGVHVAHDGLDGRRAADAVAAEQADDLALVHAQVHGSQDMTLAVERVEVGDGEHQGTACGTPRYASCTAALPRMRSGASWAMISPYTSTAMRSARSKTTLMSCSTINSVLPAVTWRMSVMMCSVSLRLMPAVGSSRRMTS